MLCKKKEVIENMGYNIMHRHGSYYKGKYASYIKLNRKPLRSRKSAREWIKSHTIGGSYRIVPSNKVKRIGKGLYAIMSTKKRKKR